MYFFFNNYISWNHKPRQIACYWPHPLPPRRCQWTQSCSHPLPFVGRWHRLDQLPAYFSLLSTEIKFDDISSVTSLEYLFCNASYPTSINVRPIVFLVVSCLVYINDLFPLSAPQWLWSFKHLQVLSCLCMNGNLLKWRSFFTLIEVHRFFMESRLSPVASLV